ncbi:MAG: PrsW family intramembrane metalloprotease [Clostridiales bacterium]|nr:PrsW family intramembrane metalloprotease [Clostridiales bacterium]
MLLFVLALIPVIGLLVFVYLKDRKEKEPFGLLAALFFAGMATVITALIGEWIGEAALGLVFEEKTAAFQIISAIFVVGFSEEIGKFLVLWLITWKNKHFDYSYDAIVYSIFVSLGFACFENVAYVFTNGVGTAIARMLTAVPGHACFAVFMGFFYSKAKYASLTKKKGASARYILLSIIVPILIHGVYDAIIMVCGLTEDAAAVLGILLWIGYVIAMFVVCFILVIRSSKHDFCIITLPENIQTVYRPSLIGDWKCTCGSVNRMNFCPKCGQQRQLVATWYCAKCGSPSALNFCGNCGSPKPVFQPPVQNPVI